MCGEQCAAVASDSRKLMCFVTCWVMWEQRKEKRDSTIREKYNTNQNLGPGPFGSMTERSNGIVVGPSNPSRNAMARNIGTMTILVTTPLISTLIVKHKGKGTVQKKVAKL